MTTFLNDIILHNENDIQFKNSSGSNAGKISQVGDDLVLSNAVGDILLGNGSDDIFIGDGTNTVDIRFEQDMAIFADSSSTRTLTLGGVNTNLVLESPTVSGTMTLGATTINNKLTFTTANGYILFDYEPSTGSNAEYSNEVPLLKVDREGTELTVMSRLTNNGALAIGIDDTVAIVAGDTKSVIKTNINYTSENVVFAAEGGFFAYGFPSNDTTWSNRNEFRFRSDSSTASDNGLYIGDGGNTQFIDLSRNLKNIGTISSGNITSTGTLDVAGDTTITNGLHVHHDEGIEIGDTGDNSTARTTLTSFNSGGNSRMKIKGGNFVHSLRLETSKNDFQYADFNSSYNGSDTTLNLHKSNSDTTGTDATTTISTGTSTFAGTITADRLHLFTTSTDRATVQAGSSGTTGHLYLNSYEGSDLHQLTWSGANNGFYPQGASGTFSLGLNGNRWSNVYTVALTASGATALSGTLTVGVDDTGHDVKFFGATSGRYMLWDESDDALEFTDSAKITLGSSGDLRLYHDGSHSYIAKNGTGNLYIMQQTNDQDISFQCDDGAGGDIEYFRLDGSLATHDGSANTARYTLWGDNSIISLGNGNDLRLYHSGTSSFISNYTGNFYIDQNLDDGDIIFRCDDGSGGLTTYMTIDGGSEKTKLDKPLLLKDSVALQLGTDTDATLYHSGGEGTLENNTGNFRIIQNTDDGDIIFKCDDGSGGTTAYLTIDGSAATNNFNKSTFLPDDNVHFIGNSYDLRIYHSSSGESYIHNDTGDLNIECDTDDGSINLKADNGSGGLATYLKIWGQYEVVQALKNMKVGDNVKFIAGDGVDLQLYHDGTDSRIENAVGNLQIQNAADDKDIKFLCDDGSGGTETYFMLDGSEGLNRFYKNVLHQDNVKGIYGTGLDLQIYHDGSNSYIDDTGTGNLVIRANGQLVAQKYTGETLFKGIADGAFEAYHNNVKKLETTSGGIDVTGSVVVSGNINANGNIVGDDSTNITNIASIGADTYGADADSTTRFDLSSDEILCLIQDEDCFSATTSGTTFHTKLIAKNRVLAKTTNSDANFDGDVVYFGGTTSMDAGKIYYFNSSGNWALADADAESTAKGMLGVALGAASDTNGVLIRGMVTLDHDPGTIGDTVFLSTTAGQASSTAPSGSGDIIRVIGYCLDSTNGQIYFNPDGTFVEVA